MTVHFSNGEPSEKDELVQEIVNGVLAGLKPNPLLDEALAALEVDNHNWSERPCSTCRAITTALGRPFGCNNPNVNRRR